MFGVNSFELTLRTFTLISCEISLFNLSIKQSAFQIFKEQCVSRKEIHFLNILFRKHLRSGGAMRDRTADLLNANQALSQLSYIPIYYLAFPTPFNSSLRDVGGSEWT